MSLRERVWERHQMLAPMECDNPPGPKARDMKKVEDYIRFQYRLTCRIDFPSEAISTCYKCIYKQCLCNA